MKMINFWQSPFIRFLFLFLILMYIFPIAHVYGKYNKTQYFLYCNNTIAIMNVTSYCDAANQIRWAQNNCKELFAKFLFWLVLLYGIEEFGYQIITKKRGE